ncbi:MAG: TRAP transporter large permease [Desulfobacteraceae bacterium]|nr:TRAP transporter large permease [Desulfobacteraceae bacterium]
MFMFAVIMVFLVTALLGMPIFMSFGVTALFACVAGDFPLQIIAQRLMIGMDTFVLLAVPGFVLVGDIMCRGGISIRAVDFANSLIGHFRGGLAMVTVFTGMIMGGISGSAVADTAAVGCVLIPGMEKEKYPKEFAAAVIGTAGPLGNIIPPSIPMIVYSMTAGLSLLDLFLSGYIPGVMIGVMLMVACNIISKRNGYGPPPGTMKFSGKNVWVTFKRAGWALFTPVIVVGGIVSGIFTPTESAMIGVFYCLFIAMFVYREMSWKELPELLLNSAKTSAKLVIIIGSAAVFSYISINEGVPEMFEKFMLSISHNKYVILFLLNLILLGMGMLIDILVATIIFVPVLIPLAASLDIAPLHIALIFVINMSIGLLTPPVGYCLYVASAIAKVPMEKVAVHSIPLIIAMLVILTFVTIFPQLTLYIPSLIH